MNFRQLKNVAALYYKNIRGWRTRRKIIVIESDDWGSIRMPSQEVYKECLKAGYNVDKIAYERFDSLASEVDLYLLFELLTSFRDNHNRHPVLTANVLTANPDFNRIRDSDFKEYHYELVTSTFEKYPQHQKCMNLWVEGLDSKVFYPQSHGREHLNISMFMQALQAGDEDVHFGFRHQMPGNLIRNNPSGGNRYIESMHYRDENDKISKLQIVLDGLNLFEQLFGYKSKSFIPPNYKWSPDFDHDLAESGVKFYQGIRRMKEPIDSKYIKYNTHYLGELNRYGQYYMVRNAIFEPSLFGLKINDPVSKCLSDIQIAFNMNKPAIICSHRLNYVGFIDHSNRDRNLLMLKKLLTEIIKIWPEVEFMNTVELGNLISVENV